MVKNHLHFKIYKPFGMLSQLSTNSTKEKRKRFLSELFDFPNGIMPIGRLDEKSEGLLLLTTDGKLSDTINRSGIEKQYYVLLDGEITDEAIVLLKKGVEIGFNGKKYQTKSCDVHRLETEPKLPQPDKRIRIARPRHRPNSWISVTITEGKFRQVRKMTSAVGFPTLRLVRIRIGNIYLNDMYVEEVVSLTNLEKYFQE
ncbi:MAG: pseudouridine synthase [Cellulophaga sp.]